MKKPILTSLLAASAAIFASIADAGVLFYNTGSASGWSSNNINSNCSVTTSTSVSYQGSSSMRCQATFNGNYNGRYHAMKVRNPFGGENDTRWIGFAFYLPTSHTFVSESMWLMQTIANYGPPEGFKPNIWLTINDTNLRLTRQSGPVTSATKTTTTVLSNLTKGRWYEVVMKIHLDDDSTGDIDVWVDGVLEASSSGPNYFDSVSKTLRVDFGIYCTTWYQKDSLPDPAGSPRNVYFDEIRIGDANSSQSEMDPSQGSGGDVIIDDGSTGYSDSGNWTVSTASGGYNGDYKHDGNSSTNKWAAWKPTDAGSALNGTYKVYFYWKAWSNRASNATVRIYHVNGSSSNGNGAYDDYTVNMQNGNTTTGSFNQIGGTFTMNSSDYAGIVSTGSANGFVIADAVKFEKQ